MGFDACCAWLMSLSMRSRSEVLVRKEPVALPDFDWVVLIADMLTFCNEMFCLELSIWLS